MKRFAADYLVFRDICPGKNEKSGSSRARFCQIWFNLKRFLSVVQFFLDVYPGKNEKTKKWFTRSLMSLDFVQIEEI